MNNLSLNNYGTVLIESIVYSHFKYLFKENCLVNRSEWLAVPSDDAEEDVFETAISSQLFCKQVPLLQQQ